MKANPTAGIIGFILGLVSLLFLKHAGYTDLSPLNLVLLTTACWLTEYQAVRRPPSDFSCGFVFCLILALSGEAVIAVVVLVSSWFVRQLKSGRTYPWDLVSVLPALLLLSLLQTLESWPEHSKRWGTICLLLAGSMQFLGSYRLQSTQHHNSESWQELSVEKSHQRLRLLVLPFALSALYLSEDTLLVAVLACPLCLAIQAGVNNLGFRVQAQDAEFVAIEAKESKKALVRVQKKLSQMSEKQRLLENLVAVFEKPLTPSTAFIELCQSTQAVVRYRSIVLFRLNAGDLEPVRHKSPETDVLTKAVLLLKTEPLVEKAWLQDRPFRGVASGTQSERLLSNETKLVAIPLKPFGVLYFGRADGEPFSKSEASKLLFVAKRAESALVRAEEDARSRAALQEEAEKAERLQRKMTLTSRLLDAFQPIMTSTSPKGIAETLGTLIEETVPNSSGTIVFRSQSEDDVSWGSASELHSVSGEVHAIVGSSRRPLYLSNLSESRFGGKFRTTESLLLIPIIIAENVNGIIVVGKSEADAFTGELHDFLCTLGHLAGSGVEALQLSLELKRAHEQVVQTSKLSAIGELAAGVAHELNTPLAAIGLAIESASMRPAEAQQTLLGAEKALDRAQAIVAGLLEHSRKKDADRALVDLDDTVKETAEMVKGKLRKRKQRLVIQSEQKGLQLFATSLEIQQILTNLILNASDAGPEGSEVVLKFFQSDNMIDIQVIDQGEGIPDMVKDRIFDPFFTTKPTGKGTGLGLSVCRELVHRHHGTIEFKPNPTGGTIFLVSFPSRTSGRHSVLANKTD